MRMYLKKVNNKIDDRVDKIKIENKLTCPNLNLSIGGGLTS